MVNNHVESHNQSFMHEKSLEEVLEESGLSLLITYDSLIVVMTHYLLLTVAKQPEKRQD